jgi:hypothetical protein
MSSISARRVSTSTAPALARRRSWFRAVAVVLFIAGALVGAYLDWMWWPVYSGLMLTIGAIAILLVGGVLWLIGLGRRGIIRQMAIAVLAVGVGVLAGQNLGPSREPLIQQLDGTMTLHLTSPMVADATGPANCSNVASATEFSVGGDSNMRLETPDRPFVDIYLNKGSRWEAINDAPRKDGVRFQIGLTAAEVSEAGKPTTAEMQASPSSTLESTFTNEGGSIRFGALVPKAAPDLSGESIDLAGTLEWTCGQPLQ